MADGQGFAPNEGRVAIVEHGSLDKAPSQGVRPVEDDDGLARLACRMHALVHGPDKGVVSASHILQVDSKNIAMVEHGMGRFAHLAVEAEYRKARGGIVEALPLDHVVLSLAVDAVLGTEDGGKAEFFGPAEEIDRVLEPAVHRSRVCNETDA